jgi:hypothetical protein
MQLEPRIRKLLLQIDAGATILLERDQTPAFLVRAPLQIATEGLPVGYGQMEIHPYDPEGPVIYMPLQLYDAPTDPLLVEAFLNPSSDEDRRILTRLTVAQYINIHFFGTEKRLPHLGSKRMTWKPEHRAGAAAALEFTKDTRTEWPAAKERYMREHPME